MSSLSKREGTRAGRRRLGYGIQVIELWVIPEKERGKATEYFCCRCRQLRLDLRKDKVRCGHCGNKDIITGPCGSLDKAALIRKLDGLTE